MKLGLANSEFSNCIHCGKITSRLWNKKIDARITVGVNDDSSERSPEAHLILRRESTLPDIVREIGSVENRRNEIVRGYSYSGRDVTRREANSENNVATASIVTSVGKKRVSSTNVSVTGRPIECTGSGGITPDCAYPPGDMPDGPDGVSCETCELVGEALIDEGCPAGSGVGCWLVGGGPVAAAACAVIGDKLCNKFDSGLDIGSACQSLGAC